MLLSISLLASLAISATTSSASVVIFKNYCVEDIFVSNGTVPPQQLSTGQAGTANVDGKGKTAIITKNNDTFAATTPKTVLGFSSDSGALYWCVLLAPLLWR